MSFIFAEYLSEMLMKMIIICISFVVLLSQTCSLMIRSPQMNKGVTRCVNIIVEITLSLLMFKNIYLMPN